MGIQPKSDGKGGGSQTLTAFEVVQVLSLFGSFTIGLVDLCYKIFKDDKK